MPYLFCAVPLCVLRKQRKFCYVNSKSARKKLVTALFNVPRQALDLLPMYSRLVAILDKVCSHLLAVWNIDHHPTSGICNAREETASYVSVTVSNPLSFPPRDDCESGPAKKFPAALPPGLAPKMSVSCFSCGYNAPGSVQLPIYVLNNHLLHLRMSTRTPTEAKQESLAGDIKSSETTQTMLMSSP